MGGHAIHHAMRVEPRQNCAGLPGGPLCAPMEPPRIPSRDMDERRTNCIAHRPGDCCRLARPLRERAALCKRLSAVKQQRSLVRPSPNRSRGPNLLAGSPAGLAVLRRPRVLSVLNRRATNGAEVAMKKFIRAFLGGEEGQVLPLTALMLVALIAIVGLSIDVSGAFMEQRWQRAITDGAALAGGQDLQMPGRQLPISTARVNARMTAMTVVANQLRATSIPDPATDPNCVNAVGCPLPGTPYRVSVYAGVDGALPRPTCLDCVPERAVQVNLSQPTFGLTFSRILGFSTWDVRASSVAGVVFARQYGVVTLRPPGPRLTPVPNQDEPGRDGRKQGDRW